VNKKKSNPMLSNISWSEYLAFILLSSLIWYAFVFYNYYRHDFFQVVFVKKQGSKNNQEFTSALQDHQPESTFKIENYQPIPTDISHVVQSFVDEVQAYLEEAGRDEVAKENLLVSLARIRGKYPLLAGSDYKDSLEQLIVNEVEANCAMFLSEDDLKQIWNET
jgi:hypothetical protein